MDDEMLNLYEGFLIGGLRLASVYGIDCLYWPGNGNLDPYIVTAQTSSSPNQPFVLKYGLYTKMVPKDD